MENLTQALKLDPENAAALMRSSMMHSFLGNYETAIAELEQARSILRKYGRSESADNLEVDLRTLQGLLKEDAPPSIVLE